jgi:predicted O-methyltransferase YrrM
MEIVEHVKECIKNAENNISKINDDIIRYEGMTGTKTRHFYNNICSLPNANYLEIGTWYGSSAISALYQNNINATLIDNWSQFNGKRSILESALQRFNTESTVKIIEKNCWEVDRDILPEFDIYMYDGAHSYTDQYRAISYYNKVLKPNCIVMIDDWNWSDVRKGTLDAFSDLGIDFLFRHEIILPEKDLMTERSHHGKHTWWNGIGIFVLNK